MIGLKVYRLSRYKTGSLTNRRLDSLNQNIEDTLIRESNATAAVWLTDRFFLLPGGMIFTLKKKKIFTLKNVVHFKKKWYSP